MRSILMLMLSITHTQSLSSCPASCVVCSDEAVICHKLSNIIAAPVTTKALMLTDGTIVSIDHHFLSIMSNITVLSFSHNTIATITYDAFWNLTVLHTLLLDHNLLSSQALGGSTFSWLQRLVILHLGNNALGEINGSWFQATGALRTLQLEGNRLTGLDAGTFASADLQGLETLDLSDNLIAYLGKDSFRGLPQLRSLDLSRNQLQSAPPEAFVYLSFLSNLNLELNKWSCTCELRDLASFLNKYTEAPQKVLFNGRKIVCVSADNPAVTTLLELTEANCVSPNHNITVMIKANASISTQRYTRDLALAAVFCFAGGVGLTIVVVYIVYIKLGMNKAWRDRTGAEEEYKERSDKNQTVAQVNLNKENQALNMTKMDLETKLMLTNSNQKGNQRQRWNWERAIYGTRIGKDDRHFTCPHCKAAVRGGGGHIGATLEMFMLEGAQPKKSLAVTEDRDLRDQRSWIRSPEVQSSRTLSRQEELFYHQRGYDIKTHVSNNGNKQPLGGRNNYLPEQRNKPSHTNLKDDMVDNQPSNKDVQTEHAGALPNYQTQTVSCVNCQRTYEYGQPGYELRDESYRVHAKRTAVYEGFPKQNPLTGLKTERNSNENQNNMDMYGIHSAREQRSVIFDMERSEVNVIDVQNIKHERKGTCDRIKGSRKMEYCAKHMLNLDITGRSVRSKDHSKRHKKHLQFNSLLKVKLNLHPFKKSKIHLQKNSPDEVEQCDDREQTIFKTPKQPKNTSKHVKSKSNSQHESTEGMETSKNVCSTHKHKAKQTSHSFEKSLQSSKNKLTSKPIDTNGVVEGNLEEENSVQPKNKESYKQKKTTSKSKHQERLGGDHPKKSRPAEDEKTDLSQKITGGETKESSGASPSSNLSAYQSKSKESVGSSVQQVEQYTNQQGQTPITEEEHPCNLGDGVTLQRTLSYPQQSTALPLAEMESTSNFSNFPGQEVKSTVSQNTSAPYTAYGGNSQIQCLSKHGSLVQLPLLTNIPHRFPTYTGNAKSLSVNQHTQPLSQTVSGNINQGAMISSDLDQFPAPQLVGAFTQLAQGPGSFNGQNISHLFQGPGSLNGDNLSNKNSMNPILHEILASAEGSPRKIRLVIPENTTNRPTSALEKKIR